MHLINLRLRLVGVLVCCVLSVTSPSGIAQQVSPTNTPASSDNRSRDDASELARHVMTTAELAIKASDRTLSVMMWVLGICLGGSALGVAGLWIWIPSFTRKIRDEMSQSQSKANTLLENAGKMAAIFEEILLTLPLLFVDGIGESDKVVALNTLAQLRLPQLAPIFGALLKNTTDTTVQTAAVYSIGMLGKNGTNWAGEIIRISNNSDYYLRRACAEALANFGPVTPNIRGRLQEMTNDVDQIVKDHAKRGLEIVR